MPVDQQVAQLYFCDAPRHASCVAHFVYQRLNLARGLSLCVLASPRLVAFRVVLLACLPQETL